MRVRKDREAWLRWRLVVRGRVVADAVVVVASGWTRWLVAVGSWLGVLAVFVHERLVVLEIACGEVEQQLFGVDELGFGGFGVVRLWFRVGAAGIDLVSAGLLLGVHWVG
ncbi:hypothetical protein Drorol1_Dr00020591 [Drosera rotundifolia]